MTTGSYDVHTNWRDIALPAAGFVRVEKESDEHGLYVEYRDVSREALLVRVSSALIAAGYTKFGEALDGNVLGFEKGASQVAVKIDGGETLYLAIFNENGVDPLLHGVVFGRYKLGPAIEGEEARNMLLKELADLDSSDD
jgi:hypothetical protein